MLEKVIENWTSRLDYIRASRGSPMPEIVFKMFLKTYKMKVAFVILLMVVVTTVVQAYYCPRKPNIQCIRASNKCCSDFDCSDGKLCCMENCGNQCRYPVSRPTNGMRADNSPTCQIDPY
ncbi:hypothetical protein TNCV_29311 [Trichonephila clavipes]|nr:hypothetical protein TNCV_29311 [Trichonephila clavipes]